MMKIDHMEGDIPVYRWWTHDHSQPLGVEGWFWTVGNKDYPRDVDLFTSDGHIVAYVRNEGGLFTAFSCCSEDRLTFATKQEAMAWTVAMVRLSPPPD